MPAQRPRASFEPIAPDFNLKALIESTPNFSYVDRISCDMIEQQGMDAFERLVTLHVIVGGKPLVIEGYDQLLDPWTFSPKWLRDNCGEKVENARNLTTKENLPLTIAHYMKNMGLLTNQFFDKPGAFKEKNRQRVYLKDIDCPSVWWDKLKSHIPNALAYLNESVGEVGGPGAVPESNAPGKRFGKGIARAGDLMSSLPQEMRAENLMCYVGHEGTYTPAHREMCASLGHNIMVEASNTVSDDGKAEKPGSSIWFMTESKDRHLVSEYWLSILGHDIEVENHFAQVVAWKKAPFNVHIVEQCPGDFILIPPLAPHQVWNRGTRTMKVAWNRTTVETLEMALNEALPRSRIVCRDEQYKNKAIVYYTLQKYASLLTLAQQQASRMPGDAGHQMLYGSKGKIKQLIKDFKRLFALYRQIMLSEMFNPEDRDPKSIEYLPFDSNVTCAYCRSNIFNRFLTCPSCKDVLGHNTDDGDPYDVCLDCYAMGRSCGCISGLKWVEQFKWKELITKYDTWRNLIIALDGNQTTHKTPLPLIDERRRLGKKTLAEVCKEQLKRRPWKDVKKAEEPEPDESDEEIVVGDNGVVKRIVKKKSKTWQKNNHACHVCCKQHPKWKMANCTTCEKWWCFGTLFRGWDKMPLDIMEDPNWRCPHCLGICFAGNCRREGKMQPYEPKGTLLGHDTRKVADARSVEALVDFSVSNLNWLKDDDPANRVESGRFKRAQAEAQQSRENAEDGDEDEDEDAPHETQVEYTMTEDDPPIDPALNGAGGSPAIRSQRQVDDVRSIARDEDGDVAFARRLQEANSSLPPPAAMIAGMPVHVAPEGYAPLAAAGYTAPAAQMYPQPDEDGSYQYPTNGRGSESAEPRLEQLRPFKRRRDDPDDDEDIAMSKQPKARKPRLAAAGFRSFDLAEEAVGASASKAKNEAQRQFEREKERKALDKAKAEGRFIMLQAALKGKKRIVKLKIPGARLAQLLAQQAARVVSNATNGKDTGDVADTEDAHHELVDESNDDVILKSDVAPKKTKDDIREERRHKERTGIIVTGGAKKALIPVEKDESYGYRIRERQNGNKKNGAPVGISDKSRTRPQRHQRNHTFDYEEVDIGSEEDDPGSPASPSGFVAVNGNVRDRRSLPNYLQNRYPDDDFPSELPTERVRKRPAKQARASTGSSAADQLLSETIAAAAASSNATGHRTTAGKRPSMRPAQAASAESLENGDDGSGGLNTSSSTGGSRGTRSINTARRGRGRPARLGRGYVPSPSGGTTGASMEEQNRLAKLQALQMVESTGSPPLPQGVIDQSDSHSNLVRMADPQFISSDESSDDGVDAVPARREHAPLRA